MSATHITPEMQRYLNNRMLTMRPNAPGFFNDVYTCAKCRRTIASGEKFYRDVQTNKFAHITCHRKGHSHAQES